MCKVLAFIPTKDRYYTTLLPAIISLMSQTRKPDALLIVDDGEQKNLMQVSVYYNLFRTLLDEGIMWYVMPGDRIGQASSHQKSIDFAKKEGYDYIWRMDDDNYATPTVLEKLVATIESDPKVGAVAGLLLPPGTPPELKADIMSNKFKNWRFSLNVQWFRKHDLELIEDNDHLYSSFLYRVSAAAHGYSKNLSAVSHTEETQFTYGMKQRGYKLVVNTTAIGYHWREPSGGIRTYRDSAMWEHDSKVFDTKMKEWGVVVDDIKVFVLENGLGDHYAFLSVLPKLKKLFKNSRIVIACVYKDVFKGEESIEVINVQEARAYYGNTERFNIYGWMWHRSWKKHIADAFVKMYQEMYAK